VTLLALTSTDKSSQDIPLRNFEVTLESGWCAPIHPSAVDWTGRLHLKVTYEVLYRFLIEHGSIRSSRTMAIITVQDHSQAWRHAKALQAMGLICIEEGVAAALADDAEGAIITLAQVQHDTSSSDPLEGPHREPMGDRDMLHMREAIDPFDPGCEMWRPSNFGSHGREVAMASEQIGAASVNTLAKRAGMSWHGANTALAKMAAAGMAICIDGLWIVRVVRNIAAQTYDDAQAMAERLAHGAQSLAQAILAMLGRCRDVQHAAPLRDLYVTRVRRQRAEYKEGPSQRWIVSVPGLMFRRVAR
jgi:hypothetical protein